MSSQIQTVKLPQGVEVLAKDCEGGPQPKRFANRTQATRAAELLGEGWFVYHPGRVFYVAKRQVSEPDLDGRETP